MLRGRVLDAGHAVAVPELASHGTPPSPNRPVGWTRWQGRTFVREEGQRRRTAEEDGAVMVLRTSTSPVLDLTADISCDWRPGDVW